MPMKVLLIFRKNRGENILIKTGLLSLPESSNVCYLLSILYSRLKDDGKAVSSFMRSLELDGSKAYRGRLDPEINRLITTYNLNLSQYE